MIDWAAVSELDRVERHRRAAAWVAGLWRLPDTQLLKFDGRSRFTTQSGGTALRMVRPFVDHDPVRHRLLGLRRGSAVFAVETGVDGALHDLREVGHRLSLPEREIATLATALINWHRTEPYCPSCGGLSNPINGGYARHCPACDTELFPRTDPAVIVAILDPDDRLLLGRQSSWSGNRVSLFAGFVEAGESLEQAVHREMAEEVDVTLTEVHYVASQPWPMPRSLMLGFWARASNAEITVDGQEIDYAAWFSRDDLTRALAADEISLPTPSSIASRLVQQWREGTLTDVRT